MSFPGEFYEMTVDDLLSYLHFRCDTTITTGESTPRNHDTCWTGWNTQSELTGNKNPIVQNFHYQQQKREYRSRLRPRSTLPYRRRGSLDSHRWTWSRVDSDPGGQEGPDSLTLTGDPHSTIGVPIPRPLRRPVPNIIYKHYLYFGYLP